METEKEAFFKKGEEETLKTELSLNIQQLLKKKPSHNLPVENLKARAKGFIERIYLFGSASRLMPLAEEAIRETARSGRSFPSCACWWAGSLSQARGRMKRTWWAPEGGLYLCITLFPALLSQNQQLYPLAFGLSACQALKDVGFSPRIRWINDVLLSGKKVCGILSKSVSVRETKEAYLLFGVGLNVNIASFPRWLKDSSTSLELESGKRWDVRSIGTGFLSRLVLNLCMLHEWEAWCLKEGIDFLQAENPVLMEYDALSRLKGRKVLYGHDLEREKGTLFVSRGIHADGSIILESSGTIFKMNTGEIRFLD